MCVALVEASFMAPRWAADGGSAPGPCLHAAVFTVHDSTVRGTGLEQSVRTQARLLGTQSYQDSSWVGRLQKKTETKATQE